MLQRTEIIAIGDLEVARFQVNCLDLDRFDDLLVFDEAGGWLPVGKDKSVADQVAVVWDVAEVAAVGEVLPPVGRALPDAVIHPFQMNPPCRRGYL